MNYAARLARLTRAVDAFVGRNDVDADIPIWVEFKPPPAEAPDDDTAEEVRPRVRVGPTGEWAVARFLKRR